MELLEEEEGGVEDHLLLVLGTRVQKILLEQQEGSNHKDSIGESNIDNDILVKVMYGARVTAMTFCLFPLSHTSFINVH